MFTHHPHPHHVWHPKLGWLTPELAERHELLVGHHLGRAGGFAHTCRCPEPCPPDSHHPQRDHPHYVEVDVSTGMIGYTRLTAKEVEERRGGEG